MIPRLASTLPPSLSANPDPALQEGRPGLRLAKGYLDEESVISDYGVLYEPKYLLLIFLLIKNRATQEAAPLWPRIFTQRSWWVAVLKRQPSWVK